MKQLILITSLGLSLVGCNNDNINKFRDLKLDYEAKLICISHVRYYVLGNAKEGVKAMTVSLDQDGKPMSCEL